MPGLSDDSTDDAVFEEMSRSECWFLVGTLPVGRIAVNGLNGAPHVVPVNYVVEGDVVVFTTNDGSKLSALADSEVTFQVDFIDPFHRTGWSVMIQGAAVVAEGVETTASSWAGRKGRVVHLTPRLVSGRRISAADLPWDSRGYL